MTQGELFDGSGAVPFEVPTRNPHDRPQSGFFDLPEEVRLRLERRGEKDCWVYLSSRQQRAARYGVINYGGRPTLIHRVTWRLLVGNIPAGATLDHLCETKSCANPAHLELVSTGENTRRHYARRRAENAFSEPSGALTMAYRTVICPVCGEEFEKTREWHTYCSPPCRSRGNKRLKPDEVSEPMTRCERILARLRLGRATGLELLRAGGGTRYSARIGQLRKAGHRILGPLPWGRPDGTVEEETVPRTVDGHEQYELRAGR